MRTAELSDQFSVSSHSVVSWPPSVLRAHPVDVLGDVLYVASLAVDAVLGVDHEALARLAVLTRDELVDASIKK